MDMAELDRLLKQALSEDIGRGDITTDAVFAPDERLSARLQAKQSGCIAGLKAAARVFELLDSESEFNPLVEDGAEVKAGTTLAEISASARALLSGERTALNLLQRMSGIATATKEVCKQVEDLPVKIVDTRKTAPGLRMLDKYAVAAGGGQNHRMGLYDAVLIKDNHIAGAGSIAKAVKKVRAHNGGDIKIEVEVKNPEEVRDAVECGADIILLDNMPPGSIREAVYFIDHRAVTEASGGITPDNVRAYALAGVDMISIGWLTHSVKAMDISMDIV